MINVVARLVSVKSGYHKMKSNVYARDIFYKQTRSDESVSIRNLLKIWSLSYVCAGIYLATEVDNERMSGYKWSSSFLGGPVIFPRAILECNYFAKHFWTSNWRVEWPENWHENLSGPTKERYSKPDRRVVRHEIFDEFLIFPTALPTVYV